MFFFNLFLGDGKFDCEIHQSNNLIFAGGNKLALPPPENVKSQSENEASHHSSGMERGSGSLGFGISGKTITV